MQTCFASPQTHEQIRTDSALMRESNRGKFLTKKSLQELMYSSFFPKLTFEEIEMSESDKENETFEEERVCQIHD